MRIPIISTKLNKENTLDYVLIVLFILFLVVNVEIPQILAEWIDTPVGIAIVIIVAFYLFFYTNPILGVLSLIVAYELLRRSSKKTGKYAIPQFLPSQEKRDTQLQQLNPTQPATLEEDVVSKMAPIGVSDKGIGYIETTFRPVNENLYGATHI
jgi:hypothetical protein